MGPWTLPFASVGSTVTMRGDFSNGQLAPVSAGPWYAYLRPDTGGDQYEPMLLGPVHIANTGGYPYIATVTFTAPQVPTGYYSVQVCDLGCALIGVGDLIGGSLVLGATESEARLFARSQIMRWMRDDDVRTIGHLRKQREELRSEVVQAQREVDLARSASVVASERAARATAEGAAAAARGNAFLDEAERRVSLWQMIAGALLVVSLIATAMSVRSRRARRVRVPDTPGELVEAAGRDRTRA